MITWLLGSERGCEQNLVYLDCQCCKLFRCGAGRLEGMQNGEWHTIRNDLHNCFASFSRDSCGESGDTSVRTPGAFSFFQNWKIHEWSLLDRRRQR